MALSLASLHSFGQDSWNEVKQDLFAYVMPLALELAQFDPYGVINGTIAFSGQDDQDEMQCDVFGYIMHLVLASAPCDATISITSYQQHSQWHYGIL